VICCCAKATRCVPTINWTPPHQPKVEHGIGASRLDRALERRLGPLDIAAFPQHVAETACDLGVPSGLRALERVACARQISAPPEHLAEEDRPLSIVKLVRFSRGLGQASMMPPV
jgi:hypothetical protein